jgi:hypothetical protein
MIEEDFKTTLEGAEDYSWEELALLDMECVVEDLSPSGLRPEGWKIWNG